MRSSSSKTNDESQAQEKSESGTNKYSKTDAFREPQIEQTQLKHPKSVLLVSQCNRLRDDLALYISHAGFDVNAVSSLDEVATFCETTCYEVDFVKRRKRYHSIIVCLEISSSCSDINKVARVGSFSTRSPATSSLDLLDSQILAAKNLLQVLISHN